MDLRRVIQNAHISPSNPFSLSVEENNKKVTVLIVGYDHPQLFTIFSGVLASASLHIIEGKLITTAEIPSKNSPSLHPVQAKRPLRSTQAPLPHPTPRKLVVDRFSGQLSKISAGISISDWTKSLQATLSEFYSFLESAQSAHYKSTQQKIQKRLVEYVVPHLRNTPSANKTLDPIRMSIRQLKTSTQIRIESTDTPFFLFNLGSVLGIHRLRIEHVRIQTRRRRIIDTINCTNENGLPILDKNQLNRIKLSILITKQFTGFLSTAPDPSKAMLRFVDLIRNEISERTDFLEFLASSQFHSDLGRLLGTSDFLWEDFIRIQQENIVPMLRKQSEFMSHSPEDVEGAVADRIAQVRRSAQTSASNTPTPNPPTHSSKELHALLSHELNEFKNKESFLIDIDHIMLRDNSFFFLSRRLSALADAILRQACAISWEMLERRHGPPRTAGGLKANWALFGLGKLGGKALGYASDLELLCMYSDNGETDGEEPISNKEFFEKFFRSATRTINAKKQGIFQVDLRLRPHGEAGPLAVKLDSFNNYYRQGGQAHSAERLALVRMRSIAGGPEFAEQCLALRDHIVYESDSILVPELRNLRLTQIKTKSTRSTINVKYNPGGLVDLEYNVQILQIIHGRKYAELRRPGIHDALEVLNRYGTIDQQETDAMVGAYRFLRNTINGLRILRGNAEDLFLPQEDSQEFRHLARRIGYKKRGDLSEAEQLLIDFETHSARVRQFVEEHLGSDAIPGTRSLSIVDIVLTHGDVSATQPLTEFFHNAGFTDPHRALVNIQSIRTNSPEQFLPLAILAWRKICRCPDPDSALNNWEQFISKLEDPGKHFAQLLSKPARMDILFELFSRSQYLADILIQNPAFFLWACDPSTVRWPRTQLDMEASLRRASEASPTDSEWCNRLRRIKKKEILRIGIRDIALAVKIEEIMGEITFLARSCTEIALHRILNSSPRARNNYLQRIVILAFGKLGGWELNYSSDIDLLCLYKANPSIARDAEQKQYSAIFRRLVQHIGEFTQEGQAYRVDMRLRPYGASGPIVSSYTSIMEYYKKSASPWEFQALLKLKPIAGNLVIGEEFLADVHAQFSAIWEKNDPVANIHSMREKSIAHHIHPPTAPALQSPPASAAANSPAHSAYNFDVKNEHGGIRDIEFYLQGQQMLHSKQHPSILTGNTLRGLYLIYKAGIISKELSETLANHYKFLRRIEHYLQLANNKQLHKLPNTPQSLKKMVKCLHPHWTLDQFLAYFATVREEIFETYRTLKGHISKP